jgi:hypothetical protein
VPASWYRSGEGFAVDGSFVHGDARRDRRVQPVASIRAGNTSARPVRAYLQALDAGNPMHEGGATMWAVILRSDSQARKGPVP